MMSLRQRLKVLCILCCSRRRVDWGNRPTGAWIRGQSSVSKELDKMYDLGNGECPTQLDVPPCLAISEMHMQFAKTVELKLDGNLALREGEVQVGNDLTGR